MTMWWSNASSNMSSVIGYPTVTTNVTARQVLPSVMDSRYRHDSSRDRPLSDAEWLDAQVEDVCALAR